MPEVLKTVVKVTVVLALDVTIDETWWPKEKDMTTEKLIQLYKKELDEDCSTVIDDGKVESIKVEELP